MVALGSVLNRMSFRASRKAAELRNPQQKEQTLRLAVMPLNRYDCPPAIMILEDLLRAATHAG